MDLIIIRDLEVSYHVGISDRERDRAQCLLLTLEIEHDLSPAAESDDIDKTINYYDVCQRLIHFGEGRSWNLIESLARDLGILLATEFGALKSTVEVKKFIIPEAQYVAVRMVHSVEK